MPDLGDSPCNATITDCSDVSECIACVGAGAVEQVLSLYAEGLSPAFRDSALSQCQVAIAKQTAKLVTTKLRALGAGGGREKGLQVLAHHLTEHGPLRMAGRVPQGRNGRKAVVAGRGFVSHDDVMTVVDGEGIAASS